MITDKTPAKPSHLRRLVAGLLMALGALGAAGMDAAQAGQVQTTTLASSLLGRDYAYSVYLPDGYETDNRIYPVVYLLHGASGDETHWPERGQIQPVMDELIAQGKIPPMVAIMPGHKGMWWVDGAGEPGESVLLKELIPEVEKRFRVSRNPEGKAVAGLSAGGYGAIRMIFQYPGMFAAAAALSPAVYVPEPPASSSAVRDPPFQKNGKFDKNLWERLNWPNLTDGYLNQPIRVPLYINSGDDDRFDIVRYAAHFYMSLRPHQPDRIEFRIVDGDHEWSVWSATIGEALIYMSAYMTGPVAPTQ